MKKITEIDNSALQELSFLLDDGTSFTITLYFMPQQYGWFIKKFVYGDFELNNYRIVSSPNMLHQFRNLLPFGLACYCEDREPMFINDFKEGEAELLVLTEDEVDEVAEIIANG